MNERNQLRKEGIEGGWEGERMEGDNIGRNNVMKNERINEGRMIGREGGCIK